MSLLRLGQRSLLPSSKFRFNLLRLRIHRYFKEDLDQIKDTCSFVKESSIADWFVLYQMSNNINKRLFYMFLKELANPQQLPQKLHHTREPNDDKEMEQKSNDEETMKLTSVGLLYTNPMSAKTEAPSENMTRSRRRRDSSSPSPSPPVHHSPVFGRAKMMCESQRGQDHHRPGGGREHQGLGRTREGQRR